MWVDIVFSTVAACGGRLIWSLLVCARPSGKRSDGHKLRWPLTHPLLPSWHDWWSKPDLGRSQEERFVDQGIKRLLLHLLSHHLWLLWSLQWPRSSSFVTVEVVWIPKDPEMQSGDLSNRPNLIYETIFSSLFKIILIAPRLAVVSISAIYWK